MSFYCKVVLCSLLLSATAPVIADVFKCKDEKGHISYQSEECSENEEAETIPIKGSTRFTPNNAGVAPESGSNKDNVRESRE